ncbi:LysM peptidoglycan-binding domain-containing protein [Fructobacillus sp. CRL 2054]|uniref:LysM peptidoglycan-binding domain-containing protein n=1 Tax=Fructobacillus sp. CRL 2054 TaxID=2763007 RepID=UPI0023794524|nr:LysM peptidoglycan-binding domain-containing protein [Fructobacillus sp. CRL 2054]MDD9138120.1 LysM peptidoglycan-binding domain-containing protein [Fructobacillus sp. CRL 2054]
MTIKNKLLVAAGLAGSVALGHHAASANSAKQHTIRSGETLTSIAKDYNVSVDQLAKENNIKNVHQIYTGENLVIDQTDSDNSNQTTTDSNDNTGSYTVQSGDNLWTLAQRFNTTVDNLASLNNIQDASKLSVGQVLKTTGTAAATQNTQTNTDSQSQADSQAQADSATAQSQADSQAQASQAAAAQAQAQAASASSSATVVNTSTASTDSSEEAALQAIINKESGGNVNATNGIYYGIGQLSPSLRARYGGNTADYQDQLQAMKAYIADRYGSAQAALAHHNQYNWY